MKEHMPGVSSFIFLRVDILLLGTDTDSEPDDISVPHVNSAISGSTHWPFKCEAPVGSVCTCSLEPTGSDYD